MRGDIHETLNEVPGDESRQQPYHSQIYYRS